MSDYTCPSCSRRFSLPFKPTQGRRMLCRVCYAEANGDLDLALAELAWGEGYDVGFERATAAAAAAEKRRVLAELGPLLRDAVRLTHPDLHPPERFSVANDVTARLIALRGQVAA